jgi:ABC-type transport system substrate-binding protein
MLALLLVLAPTMLLAQTVQNDCKKHTIDFIMVEGDVSLVSIEDDIRMDLERLGITVTPRFLSKEDFNKAHETGDFHLSFSETWGAPYDPHSFASGWMTGDEGHYHAMANLEPPASRDAIFDMIQDVLQESDHRERETKWKDIHNVLHQQAVMLPLWGKRVPTVLNNRLTGYQAGLQQFDYPVHRLQVLSGSTTVRISPGAQTGVFQSVGRLDPHTYRPNEFFANNWVYEGLVSYGEYGQILPALAQSYKIEPHSNGGQKYTFSLRTGVTFHDGTPWNCEAAKINFDHVLADPLLSADYHGWYGLPQQISEWSCEDSATFVVVTKSVYYPFLQELSFIRPLRMLSPAAFVDKDPVTGNSCHAGWGNVTSPENDDSSIICAGIKNISGTGPFMFRSRTSSTNADGDVVDDEVLFARHDNYWGGASQIEELLVVRYDTAEQVKKALLDGSLDVVWGSGVLSAQDLIEIENNEETNNLSVFFTDDVQNVLLLLNSGKTPLNDITVRKTIIHAINKARILETEMGGLERTVDNVFPLDAPYCDVELTPRWDYDVEKAMFINCPVQPELPNAKSKGQNSLTPGLSIGLGLLCVILLIFALTLFRRSQKYEKQLAEMKNPEAESA